MSLTIKEVIANAKIDISFLYRRMSKTPSNERFVCMYYQAKEDALSWGILNLAEIKEIEEKINLSLTRSTN